MKFFEQKLKHAIRLRGMRVEDFAAAMGVTRQAAYLLFKRPVRNGRFFY